MLMIFEVMT